jgi:hypothetical protein
MATRSWYRPPTVVPGTARSLADGGMEGSLCHVEDWVVTGF